MNLRNQSQSQSPQNGAKVRADGVGGQSLKQRRFPFPQKNGNGTNFKISLTIQFDILQGQNDSSLYRGNSRQSPVGSGQCFQAYFHGRGAAKTRRHGNVS